MATFVLLVIFPVAGALADWLRHAAWFVASFVVAGLGLVLVFDWIARRYGL